MSTAPNSKNVRVVVLNREGININQPGKWLHVGRTIEKDVDSPLHLVIQPVAATNVLAQVNISQAEQHPLANQIAFQPGALEKTIVVSALEIGEEVENERMPIRTRHCSL